MFEIMNMQKTSYVLLLFFALLEFNSCGQDVAIIPVDNSVGINQTTTKNQVWKKLCSTKWVLVKTIASCAGCTVDDIARRKIDTNYYSIDTKYSILLFEKDSTFSEINYEKNKNNSELKIKYERLGLCHINKGGDKLYRYRFDEEIENPEEQVWPEEMKFLLNDTLQLKFNLICNVKSFYVPINKINHK
ncbi:MAG: hypothetical protein A3G23_14615 [Bacteroidetes bacterium RIFCSPLOWO2_12_FULL_37_12]|nr:MAG: hypothetical protein A3G23_14615 [Bacteroidetes bacterium RIFCSPLOWO2_12_FULL_37_12]